MYTSRRQSRWLLTQTLVAFSAVVLLASTATAQGGVGRAGGQRMSPEEYAKVWTLQAQGVAKELGLADDLTAKVVEAYKASRTKHGEALRAAMQGQSDRAAGLAKMQEITTTERDALKAALAAIVTAEQADKAIASLGTFSRQWDRTVNALSGMGLDAEKQGKALPLLAAYAVDVDAAMKKAMEGGDFSAMRTAGQASKDKLDTAMAGVLSAEELAKWKEATAPRGGGAGGPGGGAAAPAPGATPAAPAAPGAAPAAPATPAAPAASGEVKGSAAKKTD